MSSNVDMNKREKMMDKIAALFRLAENNPSQEEAEAALIRAKDLLIQYQIDEMDLQEKIKGKNGNGHLNDRDTFEPGCVEVRSPQSRMHNWITTMCNAICTFFDVRFYYFKGNTFYKRPPRFVFYGIKTNCDIAAFAFSSVYQQIAHLGKKYKVSKADFEEQGYYSDFSIFTVQVRMEYREGLASGLLKRANEEKKKVEESNNKVTALAIRSQDIADQWLEDNDIIVKKVNKMSHRHGTNTNSFSDGVVDSGKIDIHGRGLNSGKGTKSIGN